MPLGALKQARLDAGLCIQCGAARTGPGIQARLCATCAKAMREAKARWRQRHHDEPQYRADNRETVARIRDDRRQNDACPRCGKPMPLPTSAQFVNCPACRKELRQLNTVLRTKKRDQNAGLPPDSPNHWPVGVHPLHLQRRTRRVTFRLDRRALDALQTLTRTRRDTQRASRQTVQVRDRSQILRDVLAAYHDKDCPPRWDACAFTVHECTVNLDAPTLATLERLACLPHFHNSRSAVLRTVLVFAVEPPVVARASGYRASYGYGSTGNRYRVTYAPRCYHIDWSNA